MEDDFFNNRLEGLENANNFTEWLFEKYSNYLRGNILEISSGIGTYSKKIIKKTGENIELTEFNDLQVEFLKRSINGVIVNKLDLNNKQDFIKIGQNKFDVIICSNVLEHVKDDNLALHEIYKLLKKSGILVLIVPNDPKLFSEQDKILGHYRRYTKKEVIKKSEKNRFQIVKISNFNFLGRLGWKITANSNSKNHNVNLLKIFNSLIPLIKKVDDSIFSRINGLSIIAILKK